MHAILGSLTSALTVVLGVGFLIFMHELGHFLLAKWSKVRVETFSLGFGPAIWKVIRGETEYRLSVVPLGGYVKMAGENPGEQSGADDELHRKPALNRFLIFAAGSCMNLLVALPLCILCYVIGVREEAPVIGAIAPGSAEWRSGLQTGDVILSVAGKPVRSLKDYHLETVLADPDVELSVEVERAGQKLVVPFKPAGPNGYGVQPRITTILGEVEADSPAAVAGLAVEDHILAIDGAAVDTWEPILMRVINSPGKPLALRVRSAPTVDGPSPAEREITVTPRAESYWKLDYDVLVPAVVAESKHQNPAFPFGDTVQPGDRLTSLTPADAPDQARAIVSWADLKRAVEPMAGREVLLTVIREGQATPVTVRAKVQSQKGGLGLISVAPREARTVVAVPADSAFATAGVQVGDELLAHQGKDIDGWFALAGKFDASKGDPVVVRVKRGAAEVELSVTPVKAEMGKLGVKPRALSVFLQFGIGEALSFGTIQVGSMITNTLGTLRQLLRGNLSAKGLAGPVGIFRMSYIVAEQQFSKFLWFLAFISVNLGVVNLMPMPVLDGGHILFLAVEKVRGRPVSENVMIGAQYVGLILLLSLIVWVTFFDILRTIG